MRDHSGLLLIQLTIYEGMEVEEYSCLSIIQRRIFFNRDLEIGHEVGVRHYDQEEGETDGTVHHTSTSFEAKRQVDCTNVVIHRSVLGR